MTKRNELARTYILTGNPPAMTPEFLAMRKFALAAMRDVNMTLYGTPNAPRVYLGKVTSESPLGWRHIFRGAGE